MISTPKVVLARTIHLYCGLASSRVRRSVPFSPASARAGFTRISPLVVHGAGALWLPLSTNHVRSSGALAGTGRSSGTAQLARPTFQRWRPSALRCTLDGFGASGQYALNLTRVQRIMDGPSGVVAFTPTDHGRVREETWVTIAGTGRGGITVGPIFGGQSRRHGRAHLKWEDHFAMAFTQLLKRLFP